MSLTSMNSLALKPSIAALCIILFSTGWVIANSTPQKIVEVGRFSLMDLQHWDEKSFKESTHYSIKRVQDNYVLHASANMSASALYKRIKINLRETPFLNWSWSINSNLPALNEQTKDGDDYAARIYVLFKTGVTPWSTRALNYIWSSNAKPPEKWPNAFTNKAVMIPLRTRNDKAGKWHLEKVNVRADMQRYLDVDIKQIVGVAIMTDTDNSGNFASANYGDIYFSAN